MFLGGSTGGGKQGIFTKLPNPTSLPAGVGNTVAWSADSNYLLVGHNNSPYMSYYKRNGDVFTKLANPSTLPTAPVLDASFNGVGNMLAVSFGRAVSTQPIIYTRSGDTLAPNSAANSYLASQMTGTSYWTYSNSCKFTGDSNWLVIPSSAHEVYDGVGYDYYRIIQFRRNGATFNQTQYWNSGEDYIFSDLAVSQIGQDISVSISGIVGAAYATGRPGVIGRGFDPPLNNYSTPGTSSGNNFGMRTAMSDDGIYVAYAINGSPYIRIFKQTGANAYTEITNTGIVPNASGSGFPVAFSPNAEFFVIAASVSGYSQNITMYRREMDTFIKLPELNLGGLTSATDLAFSPNGEYLVATTGTSPYIYIYKVT